MVYEEETKRGMTISRPSCCRWEDAYAAGLTVIATCAELDIALAAYSYVISSLDVHVDIVITVLTQSPRAWHDRRHHQAARGFHR